MLLHVSRGYVVDGEFTSVDWTTARETPRNDRRPRWYPRIFGNSASFAGEYLRETVDSSGFSYWTCSMGWSSTPIFSFRDLKYVQGLSINTTQMGRNRICAERQQIQDTWKHLASINHCEGVNSLELTRWINGFRVPSLLFTLTARFPFLHTLASVYHWVCLSRNLRISPTWSPDTSTQHTQAYCHHE